MRANEKSRNFTHNRVSGNLSNGDAWRVDSPVLAMMGGRYLLAATQPRGIAAFLRHFGHAPVKAFRSGRIWLVGPVPEAAQ